MKAIQKAKDPEKIRRRNRRYNLKQKFDFTEEDYATLLESQGGGCAICGSTTPKSRRSTKYLSIDHDHKTGEIRGILCCPCNTTLGFMNDDPERLRSAIAYLEK